MKSKIRSSIRFWVYLPIIILGLIAVISNIASEHNIRQVNKKATVISDTYLVGIAELSDIEAIAKDIHAAGLSHIVATDSNSMINYVKIINTKKTQLDKKINELKKYSTGQESVYNNIVKKYAVFKDSIATMIALSADTKNEAAFAIANGKLKDSSEAMYSGINRMIEDASEAVLKAEKMLELFNAGNLKEQYVIEWAQAELERAKAAYENKVEVFNYWNGKLEEMMKALYSKASAE